MAVSDEFDRSNCLVDLVGDFSWTGDQRSARIDDSLAATLALNERLVRNETISIDGDSSHVDLPVSLSADIVPGERFWVSSFEALWIDASPSDLAADVGLAGFGAISVDVEGKDAVDGGGERGSHGEAEEAGGGASLEAVFSDKCDGCPQYTQQGK